MTEFFLNNKKVKANKDETIWTVRDEQGNNQSGGKRFKIRLVSNDSGRKIDFNFRFILKKVYT